MDWIGLVQDKDMWHLMALCNQLFHVSCSPSMQGHISSVYSATYKFVAKS